jgi:hypothetical protein
MTCIMFLFITASWPVGSTNAPASTNDTAQNLQHTHAICVEQDVSLLAFDAEHTAICIKSQAAPFCALYTAAVDQFVLLMAVRTHPGTSCPVLPRAALCWLAPA